MSSIKDLASDLYPFPYSITGPGNDNSIIRLCKELPFDIYKYSSGQSLNGWLIPPSCIVEKAELRKNGDLIYDGKISPLGVPSQSNSFVGELSLDDLKPHLFVSEDENAIPYHWTKLYRPDEPLWGFCMPKKLKDSLSEGTYSVELITKKVSASMKVMIYELQGDSDEFILLNAHNCHPYQANDDISGVAVGIDVMKRLANLPSRRYSYRLMIAPELLGPMFWLNQVGENEWSKARGVILLKSVGNQRPLRLQQSFSGNTLIDRAAHHVFKHRYEKYSFGEFRAIYGNDETVFEAPPYCIPSVTLTRWPFPQYHSNLDTPDLLDDELLNDTAKTTFEICMTLELNISYKRNFSGLICLSRYSLYKPPPPQDVNGVDYYKSESGRWSRLMNALPSHLSDSVNLLELAELYELPIADIYRYLEDWKEQGLVK